MFAREVTDTYRCEPGDGSAQISGGLVRCHAGFWIRFAATLIDGVIVLMAVLVASHLLGAVGLYLPIELSVVTVGAFYSTLFIAWSGRTPGKALCGVTVRSRTNEPVGILQTLVRETLGKPASTAGLLLGFIWVAFSRQKRAWHDRLAGTIVVQDASVTRRAHIVLATVVVCVVGGGGVWVRELVQAYRLWQTMASPAGVTAAYTVRAPSAVTDVAGLGRRERVSIAQWIDDNGRTPLEYAVAKASEHQVIIFGEVHERRAGLRLLNDMIPVLYHRSGVRCVAMEVCLAEDNAALERLVTASEFDHDLAMTIARHQPWGLWGWMGYWDVLETVWRLNQTIPNRKDKCRVVGLDRRMDMPSIAMLGLEDNAARDCPPWEKLRIFRAVYAIPRVLVRDAFMAAQVEKEIIEKQQRGIVWIGRNHSSVGSPGPGPPGNLSRMGFILHQRHPGEVFQIRLHGMDIAMTLIDRTYEGPDPMMAEFLETVMQLRDNQPVGFDVARSPLAMLRDEGSFEFHFDTRLGFVDVASGYVFLAPWRDLKTCAWLEGYISQRMFVANKPFYVAFGRRGGVEIQSADDVNKFFAGMDD